MVSQAIGKYVKPNLLARSIGTTGTSRSPLMVHWKGGVLVVAYNTGSFLGKIISLRRYCKSRGTGSFGKGLIDKNSSGAIRVRKESFKHLPSIKRHKLI